MMKSDAPVANPVVVLRKEFDDWAVLFDPDSGNAFGVNPTGVFIWERLDGRHSVEDIIRDLRENAEGMPVSAAGEVEEFIKILVSKGLAGYEVSS